VYRSAGHGLSEFEIGAITALRARPAVPAGQSTVRTKRRWKVDMQLTTVLFLIALVAVGIAMGFLTHARGWRSSSTYTGNAGSDGGGGSCDSGGGGC
jgi:hypothetical protein